MQDDVMAEWASGELTQPPRDKVNIHNVIKTPRIDLEEQGVIRLIARV